MRVSNIYLAGIGSVVPPVMSMESAVADGRYPEVDAEVHGYLGIAIAGDRPAPDMALEAAELAVKQAGVEPTEVDLLLYTNTWHQGPDGWQPHTHLQRHLVGPRARAMAVHQGCNGMFDALELAACYLGAEPSRRSALLVAADNYGTPMIDRWRISPGMIGGDAAVAVTLSTGRGFAQLLSVCSSTVLTGEALHRGGEPMFPPTVTTGRAQQFDDRYAHALATPGIGARLMTEIPAAIRELGERAAAEAGIEIGDLAKVAYETHSREVAEHRVMAPLGLPMSKSTWEFGRRIGHCGASDQLLALEHLVSTGEVRAGDHVLLLGKSPGVILSAAVVKILEGN